MDTYFRSQGLLAAPQRFTPLTYFSAKGGEQLLSISIIHRQMLFC